MDNKADNQNESDNNHEIEINANDLLGELRRKKGKADEGREPQFLSGRLGTRMLSQAALIERIVAEFENEHGGDSPALEDAQTEVQKLKLVRDTAEYIFAVESVDLSLEDKAQIIRRTFAELFTYGPLDALLADEDITTILLEGADKVSVRRGHGELEPLMPIFDDEGHLRRVLRRMLHDAGTDLNPEQPIIEVGLSTHGRNVSVNLALPPVTFQMNVDLRLHPAELPSLDDLQEQGMLTEHSSAVLKAIAESPHGFFIVGDTESGKSTLMSVLAAHFAEQGKIVSVERAGELTLPADAEKLVIEWGSEDTPIQSFGDQILTALEMSPDLLILDEVRADEPHAIMPLLRISAEQKMRQAWVFRGTADSTRLISALGMIARRADPESGEDAVRSLYRKLPFVITLRRTRGQLQLRAISEWQFPEGAEYPDFVELMTMGWEGIELTGKRAQHPLDLPDNFWEL